MLGTREGYWVGGRVASPVLPHHRAYGTVHGGSRGPLPNPELIAKGPEAPRRSTASIKVWGCGPMTSPAAGAVCRTPPDSWRLPATCFPGRWHFSARITASPAARAVVGSGRVHVFGPSVTAVRRGLSGCSAFRPGSASLALPARPLLCRLLTAAHPSASLSIALARGR